MLKDCRASDSKKQVGDLAVFGGPPLFAEPLHVGRPNVGDRARLFERLSGMLDRLILTNDGPLVLELEQRLRDLTGARHVLAVCNATVGLQIAIRALGLSGEVIVPSFTFIATAHALSWLGVKPVFCDIDPVSLNLDPREVEKLITEHTTGIMGVHVWGEPCDTDALDDIARRHGLKVIYDAAHALGCTRRGLAVGNFGALEVFSLHATKFVNAFEGGAIATNDEVLAERIALARNFGFIDYGRTAGIGTNGKMSEASAAMGLTSLEAMPAFVTRNRENHIRYREGLRGLSGIRLLHPPREDARNLQHVVLRIDAANAPLSRNTLYHVLRAENVLARRYFDPGCHRMSPYLEQSAGLASPLPQTERACAEVLSLPTGNAVGPREIDLIVGLVRFAHEHGSDIESRGVPHAP